MLTVRPARPDELDLVARMTVDAYVDDGLVSEVGYVDELRAADRRAAEAVLLVAVDGDEVLGTVTYCVPGSPWSEVAREGEAEFRMLAVARSARRRGVAAALVDACFARAADEGRHTLVLSVIRHNDVAQGLYARRGFVHVPERDWRPLPEVELLVWTRPTRPGPPDAARR